VRRHPERLTVSHLSARVRGTLKERTIPSRPWKELQSSAKVEQEAADTDGVQPGVCSRCGTPSQSEQTPLSGTKEGTIHGTA
jgi:hypothetical protein